MKLIVVDDASTDSTASIVQNYMSTSDVGKKIPIQLLQLMKNSGKGGAIKAGVERARGEYVLMADADGATDIIYLQHLLEALMSMENSQQSNESTYGMTIGSRAHLASMSIQTRSTLRTILMKGFHLLVQLLCSRTIKDTQCGFKLFTRSTASKLFGALHIEGWAFDIELIYVAESLGIPINEIDVAWTEIEGSKLIKNKLDVITTSLHMARDMLCVRLCYLFGIWKLPKI